MLKQLRWGRFCSIWEVSHWEYRMNKTGSFDNWTCYQILLIKPMREYELILARFQNSRDLNIYSIACSFRWMLGVPQCIRIINLCQSGLVIVMDVSTSVGKKREIRDEGNKGRVKRRKPNSALLEVSAFDAPFLSEKLLQCFILNSKGKQYYSEKLRIQ